MSSKISKITAALAIAIAMPWAISCSTVAQAASREDIQVNTIRLERASASSRVREGYFEVPNRNTTVSAFGGQMRLYDVHLARMIALSHHFYCTEPFANGVEKVVSWDYKADNGKTAMGIFNLRCSVVEQAVKTYGLGKVVPMQVQLNGQPKKVVANIPVLDIADGAETNRFLRFVQTIRPGR
jgi:serine/threonine-protein kinase